MTLSAIDGGIYFAGSLLVFLLVQRWLHVELQSVLLLITRKPASALGIFSLLFFPGVLLHELSHYLMARLLGVRTGKFSVLPKVLANGNLRLGYVETAQTDPLRDTLIGAAPLITGMAAVGFIGLKLMGIFPLTSLVFQKDWSSLAAEVTRLPSLPDFWLWFYITFVISSTMLPSASDRRAWWSIGLVMVVLVLAALIPGLSGWIVSTAAPVLNRGLRSLAVIFTISGIVHLSLAFPTWLLKIILVRVTGYRAV